MKKRDLLIIIITLAIDQLSKYIASTSFMPSITIIDDFFWLTYAKNTGMAWSMFSNATWLLTIISLIITIVLFWLYHTSYTSNESLMCLCQAFMISGAIGNLIDRVVLGYVRDFLAFNIFGYHFPVFNVADMCLTIGAIVWILYCIFVEGKKVHHE